MVQVSSRPSRLPEYRAPPLNEVVLGVQFAPANGYQQINAGEVWGLFKPDYPQVPDMPPITPDFETFGPASIQPMLSFGLVSGAQHDRFWFMSEREEELIQFQQDRLLHNWRKNVDGTNVYPRFEVMVAKFAEELHRLEDYFKGLSPQEIVCNQAELSYVNHIALSGQSGHGNRGRAADWLRLVEFGEEPDDFSCVFRRQIRGTDA